MFLDYLYSSASAKKPHVLLSSFWATFIVVHDLLELWCPPPWHSRLRQVQYSSWSSIVYHLIPVDRHLLSCLWIKMRRRMIMYNDNEHEDDHVWNDTTIFDSQQQQTIAPRFARSLMIMLFLFLEENNKVHFYNKVQNIDMMKCVGILVY